MGLSISKKSVTSSHQEEIPDMKKIINLVSNTKKYKTKNYRSQIVAVLTTLLVGIIERPDIDNNTKGKVFTQLLSGPIKSPIKDGVEGEYKRGQERNNLIDQIQNIDLHSKNIDDSLNYIDYLLALMLSAIIFSEDLTNKDKKERCILIIQSINFINNSASA